MGWLTLGLVAAIATWMTVSTARRRASHRRYMDGRERRQRERLRDWWVAEWLFGRKRQLRLGDHRRKDGT